MARNSIGSENPARRVWLSQRGDQQYLVLEVKHEGGDWKKVRTAITEDAYQNWLDFGLGEEE